MSTVTFENIHHGESSDLGKLRFNAAGLGWKSYSTEDNDPVTFSGTDVRSAQWIRVARLFQLRLLMRQAEKGQIKFEGFKRDDVDKVKRTLDEYFGIKLEVKDMSMRGWNWGQLDVLSNEMQFQVQNKLSFDIPLSAVSNSNIAGKNEVAVEFAPPPAPAPDPRNHNLRAPDELTEIRFYVPGMSSKKGGSQNGEGAGAGSDDDDDDIEVDEQGNQVTAADAIHRAITERADISAQTGDSLVVFADVLVLTPRGRFSLEFYVDSLRLLGKSTDYRVPLSSIHRIFLLPKVDDLHVQLILGLDPPIRQGATRYPFLVAQLPKDEHTDAELSIEEDDLAKFPNLQRKYEEATFQVISKVLKGLTGKRITPPGDFHTGQGAVGVKANVKAVQGELYFLERGMLFIAKQPILIDFSKTESISFSRVGAGGLASARTFDLRVVSKTGGADHVFSAIPKEEASGIQAYLASKNVRLKNEMEELGGEGLGDVDVDMADLDDLDEESESESEDEGGGRRGRGGKGADKGKGGKGGKEVGKGKGRVQDDDDESDDESFQGSSSDGGSPSESSDDSDADSDGGGDSDVSDPMMDAIRKKNSAKKKKGGSDDEASGSEGKPVKKKAKTKKSE